MEVSVYPKIRLKTDGIYGQVFIDDHEVKGVRSFTFAAEPNAIPTVLIELNALDCEVEGKMKAIVVALEEKEGEEEDVDVQATGES